MLRRIGVRLDVLIKKALRSAPPAEAERIRKALREDRIAEVLPGLVKLAEGGGQLNIYYVSEAKFAPVEEQEETVAETEEPIAEDGLEPAAEPAEEAVEDDEYLGQHVVRMAFPEKPGLRRRLF
jgi:hypothetical protein